MTFLKKGIKDTEPLEQSQKIEKCSTLEESSFFQHIQFLFFQIEESGQKQGLWSEKAWFEFWFQHFITRCGLPSYLHTVCLSFLILTKGFPDGSAGRESTCSVGDPIPGLARSPGKGNGHPPQYSGLENSMYSPWGRKESDTTEGL